MLEHQNEHFVRDFLQFSHCVASKSTFPTSFLMNPKMCYLKIDVSCEGSVNFRTPHKMPRLPRNMRIVTGRSPDNAIRKTEPQDTCKVLRLPRKLQRIFWNRCKSIAPATPNHFRHVTQHVWMSRSATPATRNKATRRWTPPKVSPVAELTIGTATPRPSHGHLWTVANRCAPSSEHNLNPQTPRVKREPLLRIREKMDFSKINPD